MACINVSASQASLSLFSTPKIASAHQVPFFFIGLFAKETYFWQKRPIVGGNRPTIEEKETYMVENAENTFYREHGGPMIDEDRSSMRTARWFLTSFSLLFPPLLPPCISPSPPPRPFGGHGTCSMTQLPLAFKTVVKSPNERVTLTGPNADLDDDDWQ